MEQDYKNLSKLTDEELKSLYKEVRAERKRRNYLKRNHNSTNRGRIRHWKLYVLSLEQDKYYVGITSYSDVMRRFNQHKKGKGSQWTKMYSPKYVIYTKELGQLSESKATTAETAKTVELIDKYGISNVRGGKILALDDFTANFVYLNCNIKPAS